MRYELRLASGKVVEMTGTDPEHASRRYVDLHPETAVVAWREVRHGLFIGAPS